MYEEIGIRDVIYKDDQLREFLINGGIGDFVPFFDAAMSQDRSLMLTKSHATQWNHLIPIPMLEKRRIFIKNIERNPGKIAQNGENISLNDRLALLKGLEMKLAKGIEQVGANAGEHLDNMKAIMKNVFKRTKPNSPLPMQPERIVKDYKENEPEYWNVAPIVLKNMIGVNCELNEILRSRRPESDEERSSTIQKPPLLPRSPRTQKPNGPNGIGNTEADKMKNTPCEKPKTIKLDPVLPSKVERAVEACQENEFDYLNPYPTVLKKYYELNGNIDKNLNSKSNEISRSERRGYDEKAVNNEIRKPSLLPKLSQMQSAGSHADSQNIKSHEKTTVKNAMNDSSKSTKSNDVMKEGSNLKTTKKQTPAIK